MVMQNSDDIGLAGESSEASDRMIVHAVEREQQARNEVALTAPAANALARSRMTVRLLWLAVVVLVLGHMIVPIVIVSALSKPGKVALLDGTESIIVANLMPPDQADEMQDSIAYAASKALLDRNPEGFDAPESLRRLFSPDLVKKIESGFAKEEKEEYAKKQLHQKLEVARIDRQKLAGDMVVATVFGQVLSTADVGEESVTEPAWVKLNLKMVRNPFLGRNKRFPYMVVDYWFSKPEKLGVTKPPK
jgi:hypothetical protein